MVQYSVGENREYIYKHQIRVYNIGKKRNIVKPGCCFTTWQTNPTFEWMVHSSRKIVVPLGET